MRRAFAVMLLGLVAGAPPAPAGDLGPEELAARLVGTEIRWWEDGGWRRGSLWLDPDGTAEITLEEPGEAADRGVWRLAGNRLCTAWEGLRGGAEKCYTVSRGSDGLYRTSGGNVFEVFAPGA
jgi:hypothetical protein